MSLSDYRLLLHPPTPVVPDLALLYSNISMPYIWRLRKLNLVPNMIRVLPGCSRAGNALYQLHLVKAETAQSFIPKEFRLVEAFGYTLGGLFLAHYDDSPAGSFDENSNSKEQTNLTPNNIDVSQNGQILLKTPMVSIGSDAQKDDAKFHSDTKLHQKVLSSARQGIVATSEKPKGRCNSFLDMLGIGATTSIPKSCWDIQVTEISGSSKTAIGRTEDNPNLLKYSCRINCRVRVVEPAKISGPANSLQCGQDKPSNDPNLNASNLTGAVAENDALQQSISVLLSKPILALQFNFLKMRVEAPTVVSQASNNVVLDP
ncbi:hypothetical protein ACLOJK_019307 [Asimina triloba]